MVEGPPLLLRPTALDTPGGEPESDALAPGEPAGGARAPVEARGPRGVEPAARE